MTVAIENHLTTEEVATRLGVSTGRVRQFHCEGRLIGVKVGTMLLFDRGAVDRFERQHRPSGRPPRQTV